MAIIKAFEGIRPRKGLANQVVSKSFDSYSKKGIRQILKRNPYSFLHVVQPDYSAEIKSKPNTYQRFQRSKIQFEKFLAEGVFEQDQKEALYVYRQTIKGEEHTGIIGAAGADDYLNNVILKHENTLAKREEVLKDYLSVCDINAEPVCLTFKPVKTMADLLKSICICPPIEDFTSSDDVNHKLWVVDEEVKLSLLIHEFGKIHKLYIADGHHRTASSVLLAEELRAKNPNYSGDEPYNFFMSIFFPDNELEIFEFNRLVKDLYGLSSEAFLRLVRKSFNVDVLNTSFYKPTKSKQFGLYLDGKWYRLEFKGKTERQEKFASQLDVSILHDFILEPILGIEDERTDKRLNFLNGFTGNQQLVDLVDRGKYKCAFTLFPVQGEQFYNISDAEEIMPPKSTWVEPKLRSGLVVYDLKLNDSKSS